MAASFSSTAGSPPASDRLAVVVMGVSGSGKTTIGKRLAEALNAAFIDGDDLHTPAARAKMQAGHPLSDEDRWPWLDRIGERLSEGRTIVACSALRGVYRDRLRESAGEALRFVYLKAEREQMRERVAQRRDHFMPASLIDSQFETLEPPDAEADVVTVPASLDIEAEVTGATQGLRASNGLPSP